MATFARRHAMPHHHVPEPKKTSPMVDRLRLELNRTVRRTVAEAVDAVWVAFEDELTLMTMSPEEDVDNFELFNVCCRRLVKFIDSNMETTPGFVEQMDRLILACHSGTTGRAVHSMMTKDLRIRGCNKEKSGKSHVDVKTEHSITDSEPLVNSPPNGTVDRAVGDKHKSLDGELEIAATVGTESRQWATRKRLSTNDHPSKRLRSKRLKRTLPSEARGNADESEKGKKKQERNVKEKKRDKEEKKQEARDKVEKKRGRSDKEGKKRPSVRNSPKQVKAVKRMSRRMTCVQRLGKDLKDAQGSDKDTEKPQSNNTDDCAESDEVRKAEPGKTIRWNLRSRSKSSNDSSEASGIDEDNQTSSKSKVGKESDRDDEAPEGNYKPGLEEDVDITEESALKTKSLDIAPKLTENEIISEGKQIDTTREREEPVPTETRRETEITNNMNSFTEAERKADGCDVAGSEHEIEIAITMNHVFRAESEGGDRMDDCAVNGDTGHEQQKEMVSTCDDFKDATVVENARTDSTNVETPARQDTLGDECESSNDVLQAAHDEEAGSNMSGAGALSDSHGEKGNVRDSELVAETSFQNAAEIQEGEAPAETDQNEEASSESDQESPIPGLCDAGMRTPQQVSHFKACLRKSIQYVDAVFCSPPQGKNCFRNCKKIRSRQCGEGVPCRDKLCRNWHDTEAHTERCKNPLCEFTNRIFLREVMHQIANHDMETRRLQLQWEEKVMDLALATTGSTETQYTPDELTTLEGEIEQLEQRIAGAKEVASTLLDKKRDFLVNLCAIGIMPQDDAADGFPDFEAHYR